MHPIPFVSESSRVDPRAQRGRFSGARERKLQVGPPSLTHDPHQRPNSGEARGVASPIKERDCGSVCTGQGPDEGREEVRRNTVLLP